MNDAETQRTQLVAARYSVLSAVEKSLWDYLALAAPDIHSGFDLYHKAATEQDHHFFRTFLNYEHVHVAIPQYVELPSTRRKAPKPV